MMRLPNDKECPKCSKHYFGPNILDSDLHATWYKFPEKICKCRKCGYVGEKEYKEFLNTVVCPHCKDNFPSKLHSISGDISDIYHTLTCLGGCGKESIICKCGWLVAQFIGEDGSRYVIDNKCPNCNYQFYYSPEECEEFFLKIQEEVLGEQECQKT